jgi:hypothetical protein
MAGGFDTQGFPGPSSGGVATRGRPLAPSGRYTHRDVPGDGILATRIERGGDREVIGNREKTS